MLLHLEVLLETIAPLLRRGLQNLPDAALRAEASTYKRNLLRLQHQLATVSAPNEGSAIQVFERSTPHLVSDGRLRATRSC